MLCLGSIFSTSGFAFSVGFEKYELFGADFAYTNNKSYSKGTYFDFEYNSSSEKINSTENLFTKLMYRGKTIKTNDDITTETLTAYKNYLTEYLNNKKLHSIILSQVLKLTKNDRM